MSQVIQAILSPFGLYAVETPKSMVRRGMENVAGFTRDLALVGFYAAMKVTPCILCGIGVYAVHQMIRDQTIEVSQDLVKVISCGVLGTHVAPLVGRGINKLIS